jgi:hypothetical protein
LGYSHKSKKRGGKQKTWILCGGNTMPQRWFTPFFVLNLTAESPAIEIAIGEFWRKRKAFFSAFPIGRRQLHRKKYALWTRSCSTKENLAYCSSSTQMTH